MHDQNKNGRAPLMRAWWQWGAALLSAGVPALVSGLAFASPMSYPVAAPVSTVIVSDLSAGRQAVTQSGTASEVIAVAPVQAARGGLLRVASQDLVSAAAADDMVMTALTLMGTPYKFGGSSPEQGFDCSGLVQYIYRDISSVTLPRTSAEMSRLAGRDVTTRELTVGDLLFFRLGGSRQINHVAVYIGEDRFVHAPRTGTVVRIDKLDNRYWMRYFDKARRLFTDEGHLTVAARSAPGDAGRF